MGPYFFGHDYRVLHVNSVSYFFNAQVVVKDGCLQVFGHYGTLNYIIRHWEAVERVDL